MRLVKILLILVLLFPLSAFGKVQKLKSVPIVVESQKLIYSKQKHTAVYIGDVVAQHGETIMNGDRLIVYFDSTDKYVEKIEVIGHVYLKDPRGEGWCDVLYYYPLEEKAVLVGNARLKQNKNVVIGDRITAYRNGQVSVEGIKQRVKTVIYPQEREKKLLRNGKTH